MKPHPAERADQFRRLHEAGCFVIPNPWDSGSARLLQQLGFKALATTSSGFAWSIGQPDNHITVDDALVHFGALASSVTIPVNGDFEGGFAVEPAEVGANVELAVQTGIAGISIEDSTGDAANPLHEFTLAVERIRATRAAIDDSGTSVLLTARTEGYICGRPDFTETIRRLQAFAEAGADCLYAPGIHEPAQIRELVNAVAPYPVNVLALTSMESVTQLADLGARRVSVGGALARTAWNGFLHAARELAGTGSLESFRDIITGTEMDTAFAEFIES